MKEDISLTERYMLVAHVTGESFNQVQLKHKLGQQVMTEKQQNEYIQLLFRRLNGEPIQYIIGYTDFYGRDFLCEPNVLIPRFDTECLVESILPKLKDGDTVLDLCCGSGCIGLTLALEKNVSVTLADISPYALALTRKNLTLRKRYLLLNMMFLLTALAKNIHVSFQILLISELLI